MRTTFATFAPLAIGVLGVLACNTRSGSSGSSNSSSSSRRDEAILQQARAAITALEKRDEDAVATCRADVQRCLAAQADVGGSGACDELRAQCDEAERALDEVREPAVDCWHRVQKCAEEGKPFAAGDAGASTPGDAGVTCDVKPRDCEAAGENTDEDRDPILECRDAVRECWSSLHADSEEWLTECGEMREACRNICGLSAELGGDRSGSRERIKGWLERVHEHKDKPKKNKKKHKHGHGRGHSHHDQDTKP